VSHGFLKYELKWKETTMGWISSTIDEECIEPLACLVNSDEYNQTVAGVVRFLIDVWNSGRSLSLGVVSSVWLRVLDTFPQILIRAWDCTRLDNNVLKLEILKRNHLHWMNLRSNATTCVSHQFVREYYEVIAGRDVPYIGDESEGLSEACNVQIAGQSKIKASPKTVPRGSPSSQYVLADRKFSGSVFGSTKLRPQPSPVVTPSPVQGNTPVAGMTFVDPMIVKQMAAASAALSAVYDNPELVTAITKGEATPYNQLIATASIYSSLLEDPGARPSW
jgi:hypothetical protein